MKNTIIISLLILSIGVTIGWIIKPNTEVPKEITTETPAPKNSTRTKTKPTPPVSDEKEKKITSSVRIITPDSSGKMSKAQRAEMEKYQSQFGEMMKKSQQRKLNARISKLVDRLSLTPEQEAKLRKKLEENPVNPADLLSGNVDPSQIAALTGDGPLEEALDDILTEEQKEEYSALKKRELNNKIESKALKNLARLSDLDMTPEQKDSVYDILYKQAEESTNNASASNNIITSVTGGMGLNIDPEDLGLDFSGLSAPNQSDEPLSQEDLLAQMRQSQQNRIDEKVEALREVLDENQLQQYRESLEMNQNGILGGFMRSQPAE